MFLHPADLVVGSQQCPVTDGILVRDFGQPDPVVVPVQDHLQAIAEFLRIGDFRQQTVADDAHQLVE